MKLRLSRILLSATLVSALSACSDEDSSGASRADSGLDTLPSDAGGDGTADAGGDGGGDSGDLGGGDSGADGADDGGGGDTGGREFSSCVADPDGEQCGNGLDDDCDGNVDERCGCSPESSSQSCYLGAAGDLEHTNARCQAGNQTCQLEFWTECAGAIGPIAEDCDNNIDDDCDGEINNGCGDNVPTAICPDDFEDAVLDSYRLEASYELVEGDAILGGGFGREWRYVSQPPGHSFDFATAYDDDAQTGAITFFADVFGSYTFEFTVRTRNGEDSCQTVFTARTADALRIEMFWNPDYEEEEGLPRDRSDMDLYLLRDPDAGGTNCNEDSDCPGYTDFAAGQACNTNAGVCEFYYYRDNPSTVGLPRRGYANPDACHWRNCNTCPDNIEDEAEYADHECQALPDDELVRECLCRFALSNPPGDVTAADVWPEPVLDWDGDGADGDPRLDLDDTEGKGPENINVRLPEAGTYRVAVHAFDPDGFGDSDGSFRTNPVQVRILCGGVVALASEPVVLGSRGDIPFGYWQGDLWELGDLTVSYDGGLIACEFENFGTDCPRVCSLQDSDGGCSESERRACE